MKGKIHGRRLSDTDKAGNGRENRKLRDYKTGVTARAIIYWENGQRQMNIESADRLFKAMHTSIKIGE